jgi:hypothetical protein
LNTARPLTTQATGSRLRSRRLAATLLLLLHVDLPGQWGEEKQSTESEMEGARRGGHDHSALCTACVSSMSSSLPLPALLSSALPCHVKGSARTAQRATVRRCRQVSKSLSPTARTRQPLLHVPAIRWSCQSHAIPFHHVSVCFALNRHMLLLLRKGTVNPRRAAPPSRD